MNEKMQHNTWDGNDKCEALQTRFGDYDEFQKKGGNKENKIPIFDLMKTIYAKESNRIDLLEVGCGPGHFLWSFKEYTSRITGLDYSPHMVRLAKEQLSKYQKVESTFIQGSCWDIPLNNNYTDVALQVDVCMHIGGSWEAIKEMIRVSRKYVIFTGPSFENIDIMNKQIAKMSWAVSVPLLSKELDDLVKLEIIQKYEFLDRPKSKTYNHKILFITI